MSFPKININAKSWIILTLFFIIATTSHASASVFQIKATSPSLSLTVNKTAVLKNGGIQLSWSSTNTTYCDASGSWEGKKEKFGKETLSNISEDSTFSLTCYGRAGGTANMSVKVNIIPDGQACKTVHGSAYFCTSKEDIVKECGVQSKSFDIGTPCNSAGDTICAACISDEDTKSCQEPDNGINPEQASYLVGLPSNAYTNNKATDYCKDQNTLREYYLSYNTEKSCAILYKDIKCDCQEGPEGGFCSEPSLRLQTNATAIYKGDSVDLKWESFHTDSCTATGDWSGEKTSSGSETISNIQKDSRYILRCDSEIGTIEERVEVKISEKPPLVIFVATTDTVIPKGGDVHVRWDSENTDSCIRSWDPGVPAPIRGEDDIKNIQESITYGVTCSGPGGEETQMIDITVDDGIIETPQLFFEASPMVVEKGSSTILKWKSDAVDTCSAGGDWQGTQSTSGERVIQNVTKNMSFTLECTQNTTNLSITRTVQVTLSSNEPTLSFYADKNRVRTGKSITLNWNSQNIAYCIASGDWYGKRDTEGFEEITNLKKPSTFTLLCTGANGDTITKTVEVEILTPPPTVHIYAEPDIVKKSGSTVIHWETENAISCLAAGQWSGTRQLQGSEAMINMQEDSQFTLICTGPGGEGRGTAYVQIVSVQPTVEFYARPNPVPEGDTLRLLWKAEDADYCTASGDWNGEKPPEGMETIDYMQRDSIFAIECVGPGGKVRHSIKVAVLGKVPSIDFIATPVSIGDDGSTKLQWITRNLDSCTASGGWEGDRPLVGTEKQENVFSDTSYTLTCKRNAEPNLIYSRTVRVVVDPDAIMLNFNVDKELVALGDNVTLSWKTSDNVTSCTASGSWEGEKQPNGREIIGSITSNADFTLTCTNLSGDKSLSSTVKVKVDIPEPQITFFSKPNIIRPGEAVNLQWNTTYADTCTASGHDQWTGNIQKKTGLKEVKNIVTNTEFTLECTGPGGTTRVSTFVMVDDMSVLLTVRNPIVERGESTYLNWRVIGAKSCKASGGWNGEKTTNRGVEETQAIMRTTRFILTCENNGIIKSDSVLVKVEGSDIVPIDPPELENPLPQPPGACHRYTNIRNTQEITKDFGYPWDVFSKTKDMISSIYCSAQGISAFIGNGNPNHFIWHKAYITKNGFLWNTVELKGQNNPEGYDNWFIGSATLDQYYTPRELAEINFIATYQCTYVSGQWKCGCRDEYNCSNNGKYTLQSFQGAVRTLSLPNIPPPLL